MNRGPYQGVMNVVRFNYDMYLKAACVLLLAFLLPWPDLLSGPVRLGAWGASYFLLASLGASHYIYDCSALYRWTWMRSRFPRPTRILNVHSGFDETSSQLRALYPEAVIQAVDFYDAELMSEPSIERARKLYPPEESLMGRFNELPFADGSESLICVLLAAHELREHDLRVEFFRELERIVSVEGHVIVLEHMRDTANFLVFGSGFLHFFPRSDWLRALKEAGFSVREEFSVTPFLRGFVCRATSS